MFNLLKKVVSVLGANAAVAALDQTVRELVSKRFKKDEKKTEEGEPETR